MKTVRLLFTVVLFVITPLSAQVNEINPGTLTYIRNEFYLSIDDEDKAENLLKFLKESFYTPGTIVPARAAAYAGAVEAIMAKHVFNPYRKYKYIKGGLNKLNKAVKDAPSILEVRFLRFAVLHNIPAIFGVGDERIADLNTVYELLLQKDYRDVGYNLQKGIAEFLLDSERISPDQEDNLLHLFPGIERQ